MPRVLQAVRAIVGAVVAQPGREALAVAGGFLALAAVMTDPVVRHLGDGLPGDLGDPLLNAIILAWDADRLRESLRGLWDAPFFFPYPKTLTYSEHLLGIAVFVAPVSWLTANPLVAYNLAFVGSYALAGAGMYLLVRELTANRWASAIAGVAFAYSPYRADQISHLQVLMSGWMPVALWALHRYFRTGRRRALAGFVVAFVLQGLSNGYYLFFFTLPVAVVAAHGLLGAGAHRGRAVRDLVVAGLAIAAAVSPVAWAYTTAHRALGFRRTVVEMQIYSADLVSYLCANPRLVVWGRMLPRGGGERAVFPGATVTILAATSLAVGLRRFSRPTWAGAGAGATGLYATIALAAFLLSLGPQPTAWGRPIVSTGPYRWLVMVVPGLDGLRVPSRIAMVVVLALAVLAGLAVSRLWLRVPRRARPLLGIGLAAALALEGYAGPLPIAHIPPLGADERRAYAWLAGRPPGGLVELPVEGYEPIHSLLFQFRALEHGHPIVNGFSGHEPPLVGYLKSAGNPFFDLGQMRELLRGLRWIGVRYVAVHERLFEDRAFAQATVQALETERAQVEAAYREPEVAIFQLRALARRWTWKDDRLRRVPTGAFEVASSHGAERLPLAFDGEPGTRWLSGRAQTGDEWIELKFDRPRPVARLRFEVSSGSMADYARRLRVEGSRDGVAFDQLLFEDALLPYLLVGVARPARAVFIDVDLPPNESRAIRLRQTGRTRTWFWSIDELTVWERRTAP